MRRSGDHLRIAPKGGQRLLVCDGEHCVGRRQERADEVVTARAVERLSRPDAASLLAWSESDLGQARGQVEALRARRDAASDDYATGGITVEPHHRITAPASPSRRLPPHPGELAAAWRAANPDEEWIDPLIIIAPRDR